MNSKVFISLLSMWFFCTSCKLQQPVVRQGIFGKVTYISGNQMPSPDKRGKSVDKGVVRWLAIYELTDSKQVSGQAPMYTQVRSKLVTRVQSDAEGQYKCSLYPGRYSVFVEENNEFFANSIDNEGYIASVQVKTKTVTELNIRINYKALY